MAKKTDKAVKELAKEVKKLRKENEKLAKTLEKTYEDRAAAHRELRNLLEERLLVAGTGTDEAEDHSSHDEDGGFVTAETATESDSEEASDKSSDAQEEPEVTDAAKRRAKELGVDPTSVEGTGSSGRILVKDVEAAAGQSAG
ncbi:MAG: E3 binding domain-containing protein [Rubrobacteraceae bacterium]|nr:E3 binding domain-containing protein [Rubrobacteraceae bacterium]